MKHDAAYCLDSTLVIEAVEVMRGRSVGFLPVCTAEGAVVGALTDRDVVVRVLAPDLAADRVRVGDVMTENVVSCGAGDDVAVAEERMSACRKSRIVCLDRSGGLAGVISLSDLARSGPSSRAGVVAASISQRESWAPVSTCGGTRVCRDVMHRGVESCRRDASVVEVAVLMREADVGFVPVRDESGAVIGALTDRDLALRVVAERRVPALTHAADVLTPELVYCRPDDELDVAEALMLRHKTARIVCAADERHVEGVLSLSDLARAERPDVVARLVAGVTSRA